jgi:hypothetical protein
MNFRSHPKILDYPNQSFYGGELRVCGDPAMIQSLETVEELPKPKFPLAFHGIIGRDQREQSSPSFFNAEEASLVKKYVHALTQNRKYRISKIESLLYLQHFFYELIALVCSGERHWHNYPLSRAEVQDS